jgi:hypothetical protein
LHHCSIGLPWRRIPPCHTSPTKCFFGAICGGGPITSLTRQGGRQTLVRTVGLGFSDDPESTRMREFFQKGNDYTLSELRKRFDK